MPVVALPYSPDNMSTAKDASDWKLDRAYIGSCTGGKLTDFIMAAEVLKDKKVSIDTFLVPATREVEAAFDAISFEGRTLKQIFMDAGCIEPAPPFMCGLSRRPGRHFRTLQQSGSMHQHD